MFFNRLAGWLKRFAQWLALARPVWIALLVPILTATVCWLLLNPAERSIRFTGLFLEFAGIVTVLWGLRETRQLFRRPSFVEAVRDWFKAFPRWNVDVRIIAGTAGISLGGGTASAYGTVGTGPDATLKQRVAALESNLKSLTEVFFKTKRQLELDVRMHTEALSSEKRERTDEDSALRKLIDEAVAGGLVLEVTGIFWLLLGLVLATASAELSGMWR